MLQSWLDDQNNSGLSVSVTSVKKALYTLGLRAESAGDMDKALMYYEKALRYRVTTV